MFARLALLMTRPIKPGKPFRCFNSLPEGIRVVVIVQTPFLQSLGNAEWLLHDCGATSVFKPYGRHCLMGWTPPDGSCQTKRTAGETSEPG
jgi:hypothetical protein